ncbi:MAG: phenylacetate--CoA ligase family protein, partial [Actinomycetota bacterium]|nr:phenylacetate--CoA ligase family protein [Actinomycetota bacterium]
MHRNLFTLGYLLKRPEVIRYYNEFLRTQFLSYEDLKAMQEEQLKKIIHFAYENVPYYTKLFEKLGLKPNDINVIKDLERLPILTKMIIKKNWQDFIPRNIGKYRYVNGSTGGSTGEPLKYRMSLEDYERGTALLYRGFGYAGYKLGDKVAVIAGSSLIPTTRSETKKKIQNFFLNTRHYSSFNMSEQKL